MMFLFASSSFSGVNVTVFAFLSVCGVLFPFNFARFALFCAARSAARFPPARRHSFSHTSPEAETRSSNKRDHCSNMTQWTLG